MFAISFCHTVLDEGRNIFAAEIKRIMELEFIIMIFLISGEMGDAAAGADAVKTRPSVAAARDAPVSARLP